MLLFKIEKLNRINTFNSVMINTKKYNIINSNQVVEWSEEKSVLISSFLKNKRLILFEK